MRTEYLVVLIICTSCICISAGDSYSGDIQSPNSLDFGVWKIIGIKRDSKVLKNLIVKQTESEINNIHLQIYVFLYYQLALSA